MSTTLTYALKVPKRFFEEHCERDCIDGQYDTPDGIVKKTKTHYYVVLNTDDAVDLLDDAHHYSDSAWIAEDSFYIGIVASARATKKAVALQLHEQGYEFDEHQIQKYGLAHLLGA